MTAAKKIRTPEPLDTATLPPRILHALARHALIVTVTGIDAVMSVGTVEHDKRSQAKVMRDLCDAGWLTGPKTSEYDVTTTLTPEAILALASEPTAADTLPPWHDDRGDRLVRPCSPVMAIASGYGTYTKSTTDALRAQVWRVLHPEHYRWALVPSDAAYHGYCPFPIPLDATQPIAPQVKRLNAEWQSFTAKARPLPGGLDLLIADETTVLRHQQDRARNLWRLNRGRTLLALARFGGFTKAAAADEADEADVDEIPSLGGGGFIRSRTSESYDPKLSWEDEAQRQLTEADEAIARAQVRRAALLKRYTTVAIANPGPRPYDAMRARYDEWIANYVIEQTGVDPRTLPETP